jgi:kynurenine formamidase
MAAAIPSEDEVLGWTESFKNWGRWGPDDELGTINLITAEKRRRAARLVTEGVTISCARPISYDDDPFAHPPRATKEYLRTHFPTHHFMLHSGEGLAQSDSAFHAAADSFLIAPHGLGMTHLDGLSHFFWKGFMYNGRPAHVVSTGLGAAHGSVDLLGSGVSTRGVLLDIAALKGVDWLEPGTPVHGEDLEAAERRQGVEVTPGDVLFVRTGHVPNRRVNDRSGLHASCLPFLRDRGVAMLGGDAASDVMPSGYEKVSVPIHIVGIVAMGLWLIDNCHHEELAAACANLKRWEFLVTIAPLKLPNSTGCPVNPIVLL